mmetsp:Transcript_200/g.507  ORF Transcript_200/g.507 Transcript_200/m.507 type:complete len:474 (+) Transcript_200:75-1496(+)
MASPAAGGNDLESRSMRMFLQSMPKKGFVCLFLMFGVVFTACVVAGILGPPITDSQCPTEPNSGGECVPVDFTRMNAAWIGNITNLDKLNQQLYLVMSVELPPDHGGGKWENVTIWQRSYGHRVDPNDPSKIDTTDAVPRGAHNYTIECPPGGGACANITLVHFPFIAFTNYTIMITVPETNGAPLEQVKFNFVFRDHKFTLFELWFRFAFLLLTFVAIIVFAHKLRHYRWTDWQVEQKWTAFILFGLMAANNPFFPLEILVASWFPVFLDQVLMVTFLCMLLLFWLIMFDGVRKDAVQRSLLKFYLPKVFLVAMIWVVQLTVFAWQEIHLLQNPQYDELRDDPNFLVMMVTMLVLLVVYLFWMVYVVARACLESKTYPLLGVRIRFFGLFTLAVIVTLVGGLLFAAFGPVHNNAAEFLAEIALLNLYVYVLAFVYLPAKTSFVARTARAGADKIGMVAFEDEGDDSLEEIDH